MTAKIILTKRSVWEEVRESLLWSESKFVALRYDLGSVLFYDVAMLGLTDLIFSLYVISKS